MREIGCDLILQFSWFWWIPIYSTETAQAPKDCKPSVLNLWIIAISYTGRGKRKLQVVVCFLLSNSGASEFYMPTFRNTLFHLHRRISGSLLSTTCSVTGPNRTVTLLPNGSGHFRAKPFSLWIPPHFLNIIILHLSAYEDGTDRVFRNVCI